MTNQQINRQAMNHDELVALFKPDEYGFCRVKVGGKTEGFWFDTVEKVMAVVGEASN